MGQINASDVEDAGFVSEDEMRSDGLSSFRSEPIVDIVSGTISFAANTALINYDDPIQDGDLVVITGNAAAGTYTVSVTNLNLDDFEVVEAIVDAAGGSAAWHHPAGATRVGIDSSAIPYTSADNLQEALQDVPIGGFLPRVLTSDLTVPGDKTALGHDVLIEDGVEVLILDGGEVLCI